MVSSRRKLTPEDTLRKIAHSRSNAKGELYRYINIYMVVVTEHNELLAALPVYDTAITMGHLIRHGFRVGDGALGTPPIGDGTPATDLVANLMYGWLGHSRSIDINSAVNEMEVIHVFDDPDPPAQHAREDRRVLPTYANIMGVLVACRIFPSEYMLSHRHWFTSWTPDHHEGSYEDKLTTNEIEDIVKKLWNWRNDTSDSFSQQRTWLPETITQAEAAQSLPQRLRSRVSRFINKIRGIDNDLDAISTPLRPAEAVIGNTTLQSSTARQSWRGEQIHFRL